MPIWISYIAKSRKGVPESTRGPSASSVLEAVYFVEHQPDTAWRASFWKYAARKSRSNGIRARTDFLAHVSLVHHGFAPCTETDATTLRPVSLPSRVAAIDRHSGHSETRHSCRRPNLLHRRLTIASLRRVRPVPASTRCLRRYPMSTRTTLSIAASWPRPARGIPIAMLIVCHATRCKYLGAVTPLRLRMRPERATHAATGTAFCRKPTAPAQSVDRPFPDVPATSEQMSARCRPARGSATAKTPSTAKPR